MYLLKIEKFKNLNKNTFVLDLFSRLCQFDLHYAIESNDNLIIKFH